MFFHAYSLHDLGLIKKSLHQQVYNFLVRIIITIWPLWILHMSGTVELEGKGGGANAPHYLPIWKKNPRKSVVFLNMYRNM